MSGKLDQSLDEILSTRRKGATRGRGGRRASNPGRKTATAPVGGVTKHIKLTTKNHTKGAAQSSTSPSIGSKIIVSNLVSSLVIQLDELS